VADLVVSRQSVAMSGVRIIDLDLLDGSQESLAREWLDVHLDANEAIWGPGVNPRTTLEQMRVAHRSPTTTRVALAALEADGVMVGSADVLMPVRENTDTAGVWLSVRPARWRQGIGTLLIDHVEALVMERGRTRMLEHSGAPVADGDPASGFAVARGYECVLTDLRQEVALPLPTEALDALTAQAGDPAYEILTAWDELPEEWLEGRARLARRMSTDAPSGVTLEEEDGDADRVREQWERHREMGHRCVESIARHGESGELVAYSDVVVEQGRPEVGVQSDTLVLREHRGHHLGLTVKLTNLRALQSELPGVTVIRTWNSDTNAPMLAVNVAMGFEVVGWTKEWAKQLA